MIIIHDLKDSQISSKMADPKIIQRAREKVQGTYVKVNNTIQQFKHNKKSVHSVDKVSRFQFTLKLFVAL